MEEVHQTLESSQKLGIAESVSTHFKEVSVSFSLFQLIGLLDIVSEWSRCLRNDFIPLQLVWQILFAAYVLCYKKKIESENGSFDLNNFVKKSFCLFDSSGSFINIGEIKYKYFAKDMADWFKSGAFLLILTDTLSELANRYKLEKVGQTVSWANRKWGFFAEEINSYRQNSCVSRVVTDKNRKYYSVDKVLYTKALEGLSSVHTRQYTPYFKEKGLSYLDLDFSSPEIREELKEVYRTAEEIRAILKVTSACDSTPRTPRPSKRQCVKKIGELEKENAALREALKNSEEEITCLQSQCSLLQRFQFFRPDQQPDNSLQAPNQTL